MRAGIQSLPGIGGIVGRGRGGQSSARPAGQPLRSHVAAVAPLLPLSAGLKHKRRLGKAGSLFLILLRELTLSCARFLLLPRHPGLLGGQHPANAGLRGDL